MKRPLLYRRIVLLVIINLPTHSWKDRILKLPKLNLVVRMLVLLLRTSYIVLCNGDMILVSSIRKQWTHASHLWKPLLLYRWLSLSWKRLVILSNVPSLVRKTRLVRVPNGRIRFMRHATWKIRKVNRLILRNVLMGWEPLTFVIGKR